MRRALVLFIAMAACRAGGGAPAPSEPLVIPPLGSADAGTLVVDPSVPEPPRALSREKHKLTPHECDPFMGHLVELTLDETGITDPKQREEIAKAITGNTAITCDSFELSEAELHCALEAKKLAEFQSCVGTGHGDDD